MALLDDAPQPRDDLVPRGIFGYLDGQESVEVVELDKSGVVQKRWLHVPGQAVIPIYGTDKPQSFLYNLMRDWRKALYDAFLPVGFPHSVSKDYLAYQTYDSLQAFFSTITSLLASRALLEGLGVGDASSSATFAMLLTILKDAMSRVATIVFAQRFGLRIEPDAKRYRFLADLFNDTAFFLELYSPYLGPWGKVAALSTGEALRALCGVAAGASKAALSVHFAKHDNLAELNAKEASQETAVGLVGLLVGTFVVKWVEDHRSVVSLMIILVFAHLWMNYLGVRSVCMTTLNRQRATILFSRIFWDDVVLTPEEVAQEENILFWDNATKDASGDTVGSLEFAQSYAEATRGRRVGHGLVLLDGDEYSLFIVPDASGQRCDIRILLHAGAVAGHGIVAWYRALFIARHWRDERAAEYIWEREQDLSFRHVAPLSGDDVLQKLSDKGWNLYSQAFETGAPVRLSILPRGKKDD